MLIHTHLHSIVQLIKKLYFDRLEVKVYFLSVSNFKLFRAERFNLQIRNLSIRIFTYNFAINGTIRKIIVIKINFY